MELPGHHKLEFEGLNPKSEIETRARLRGALDSVSFQWNSSVRVSVVRRHTGPAINQDLAIAVSLLALSGKIPRKDLSKYCFIGSLDYGGSVRFTNGIFPMVEAASAARKKYVVVPHVNSQEAVAAASGGITVLAASTLTEVLNHLSGKFALLPVTEKPNTTPAQPVFDTLRLTDYVTQGLEIVVAGEHLSMLTYPHGYSMSLITRAMLDLMPDLIEDEFREITRIRSSYGMVSEGFGLATTRPYRAPHFTAGPEGIEGEYSLAHHGLILFDDLPDFPRQTIASLHSAFETRSFQWVGAMPACPGGHTREADCNCGESRIGIYYGRTPGWLIAKIPIWINFQAAEDHTRTPVSLQERKNRVLVARARAVARKEMGWKVPITPQAQMCLDGLPPLLREQVHKVALTVRDLRPSAGDIRDNDVLTAMSYGMPPRFQRRLLPVLPRVVG